MTELENKSVEGTNGERTPELIAVEINAIKRNVRCMMVSSAAEIGKRLTEAKRLVPYGRWGEYLAGLDYSDRTAQNLMRPPGWRR